MKKIYTVLFVCFCVCKIQAQNTFPSNGSVGIGTTAPNTSSILEIKSTSKGVLVPRMTMAQRNAIVSPAQSLIVFQTDSPSGFYYYDGSWKSMSALGNFATTKLDNLDANIAISQNLLPNSNNAKDLGSSAYGWRNLYVNGIGYLTAAQLGNYTGTPQAGMLRWTGTAFQGYNGSSWITLSGGPTYVAGTGISISGNTITNTLPDQTVKITGAGAATVTGTYPNFTVSSTDNDKQTLSVNGSNLSISNGNTVAIPQTSYTAGNGINVTGTTITNTAPDKPVSLIGTGATTVSGTYPNFTINSTDNNTTYTAGNGLSLTGNVFANTAPDQTVALTGSGATTVTGTYPNFTVSSSDAQTLALNENNLSISNGNSITLPQSTDAQTLSVSGNNLSISNGNTVTIPQANYIAGTGINITGTTITNTAPSQWNTNNNDISYTNGNIGIGTSAPGYTLDVNGDINLSTGSTLRNNGNIAFKDDATYGNVYIGNDGNFYVSNNTKLPSAVINNTAFGADALYSNINGSSNIAIGAGTLFSNTSGKRNTAMGTGALYSNSTGYSNTATGIDALFNNSSGHNLVAVGDSALYNQITNSGDQYSNTAIGSKSLFSNTTGYNNTANGFQALYSNNAGFGNTANGCQALFTNIGREQSSGGGQYNFYYGNYNTAIGFQSLYSNTDGNNNTANGSFSLYSNSAGIGNTANGFEALYSNTTGNDNTATGSSSLYYNTTGGGNTANGEEALYYNTTGGDNTANGYLALHYNTTGSGNTVNGELALGYNSTGNENTADGTSALYNNNSGGYNTAMGTSALLENQTGNDNTALGYNADVNASDYSNTTVIGANAIGTDNNQVRIGDDNVTSIGGYANWTNISDGRVKKNIKENVPGLAFINKLNPVTYNLNLDEADKIIQRPAIKDKDGKIMQPSQQELDARKAKMNILYTGFVAQDVEKAGKSLNYDFSGVDAPKNDKDLYGLRYAEFVVPLVKAVQELSKQNDDKNARIDSLEKQNNDLQKQFADLKQLVLQIQQTQQKCTPCSAVSNVSTTSISTQLVSISSASLDQNIPNPFSNETTINYSLPQNYSSARIIITNKLGKTLKEINVSGKGKGSLKVDASTLANGAYQYSLYVNNKLIDTKQMVSQK
jgi:trimeric autotransporter adhesin